MTGLFNQKFGPSVMLGALTAASNVVRGAGSVTTISKPDALVRSRGSIGSGFGRIGLSTVVVGMAGLALRLFLLTGVVFALLPLLISRSVDAQGSGAAIPHSARDISMSIRDFSKAV